MITPDNAHEWLKLELEPDSIAPLLTFFVTYRGATEYLWARPPFRKPLGDDDPYAIDPYTIRTGTLKQLQYELEHHVWQKLATYLTYYTETQGDFDPTKARKVFTEIQRKHVAIMNFILKARKEWGTHNR